MKRGLVALFVALAILAAGRADAQDSPGSSATATVVAYQTQVAELEAQVDKLQTSVAKRDAKIDEQRTRIAELKEQVPPTATPTPRLTGKDAFPYVADPLEIFTRPFNHLGEKMSFCGTVTYIEVARPGRVFVAGDTVSTGWSVIAQILVDGYDVRYVVGFNGETTGVFENTHVCAWGTLVDTFTGTNAFGGALTNPLFDAEYLEVA